MKTNKLHIFKNVPELRTERLVLRKIKKSDIYDVFEYAKDPAVSEYLLWSPHESLERTRAYLDLITKKYSKLEFYDWAIEYRGKMIGTVGFTSLDLSKNIGEVGYALNSNFWGLGIATEAARKIIEFGFCNLGLDRIFSQCIEGHNNSINVMKKCGMHFDGTDINSIYAKGKYLNITTYYLSRNDFFKNIKSN